MGEFRYEDGKHEYTLDGIVIPSVTQVMEYVTKPIYENINPFHLENARIRGKEVHRAIEFFAEFGVEEIDEEYTAYLQSFIEFLKDTEIKVTGTEVQMYHPLLRYAGTIDILAQLGDRTILIDIKTYKQFSEKTERLQTEAYSNMANANGYKISEKWVVLINDDGYKIKKYPQNDREAKVAFESMLKVKNYMEG